MRLNISFPVTGCQKLIEVDDERTLRTFYEKPMATEVAADALGEEWKGYVVQISGGNNKQDQGELEEERENQFVVTLWILNLVIVRKGEKDIPGLADTTLPRHLGPKRASRIRKCFNLSKEDDVCQYVVRKPLNKEGEKPSTKAPKIQRVLQHEWRHIALKKQRTKKNKEEPAEYAKLLVKGTKEAKEKCQAQTAKRHNFLSVSSYF
ncbi:40S ribosomal protein S6 [Plecturocebus cupreus]